MREYVGYRQRLEAIVERIRATGGPDTLPNATVSALGQYLEECEQQLITLMNGQQPAPNAPGNVEFGLMLYLLDQVGLGTTLGLPPTQITLLLLLEWMLMLRYGPGVTADDGTLIGLNTYEQLDPGWFEAVLDYIDTFLNKTPKFSPFPTNPNRITATGTGTTTIALFETGEPEAGWTALLNARQFWSPTRSKASLRRRTTRFIWAMSTTPVRRRRRLPT